MNLASTFSSLKNYLYKNYGEKPGKMLVHTGVLGWVLSSLAQITAIVVNDKISPDQKSFLIPQEIADALVNILSFYIVTSSFKSFGEKLVSMGKLRTPKITEFLKKNDLFTKSAKNPAVGNIKFDIEKLVNYKDIKPEFKSLQNGVGVVTGIVGSILSSNLITPIGRNYIAANQQKEILAKKAEYNMKHLKAPRGITIQQYQNMAYRNSSDPLKV